MEINWDDPESMISNHFKVKEALTLPSWQIMHIPSDEEKANIAKQAQNMDLVRDFLGVPLVVHCWIRPLLNNPASDHNGENYNQLVGGGSHSAHISGFATDFHAVGIDCDTVRSMLEPKLEEFGMKMERNPGSNWVHLGSDDLLPGHSRYFNP